MTPYEYAMAVHGAMPTGLMQAAVRSHKAVKNLLQGVTWTDGYYIAAGGAVTADTGSMYSDYIPVTVGSSYKLTGTQVHNVSANKRIHGYKDTKAWKQQITYKGVTPGPFEVAWTVPSGVAYIRISCRDTDEKLCLTEE